MADQTVRSAHSLEALIDSAFERRADITPSTAEPALLEALDQVIAGLNAGRLRVAEKLDGTWVTHQWIKKAVLLYFRTHDNQVMPERGQAAVVTPGSTRCRCGSAATPTRSSARAASAWCRPRPSAPARSSAATSC